MDSPSKKSDARYYPWDMLFLLYSPLPLMAMMMWTGSLSFLSAGEKTFAFCVVTIIALTGVSLLAWAKWPLYQQGIYCSFGPSSIPESRRTYYRWGMGMIVVGGLLFTALAF
jgi:hypothetical protein